MWNVSHLRDPALNEYGRLDLSKSEIKNLISKYSPQKVYGGWPEWTEDLFNELRLTQDKTYDISFDLDGSSPGPQIQAVIEGHSNSNSNIPRKDPNFVKTEYFKKIYSIVRSGLFMPTYVTGLSGLGKTETIVQVCAHLKRELIRVNITSESAEKDLIGKWTIQEGKGTVWEDGPVIIAMKSGSVLLLDEIDLGTDKIMCLQSILEGSGYFNKQTKEYVNPVDGFTIFATANTKGASSSKFYGTKPLNEALLDRFDLTIEQEYPTPQLEKTILSSYLRTLTSDKNIIEKIDAVIPALTVWSEMIRRCYKDGQVTDVISTRRLKAFVKSAVIFGNISIALNDSVARFNAVNREAFIGFFRQVAKEVDVVSTFNAEETESEDVNQ